MGRVYRWRYRCFHCGKMYAKPSLWVRHLKACAAKHGK